MKNHLAGFILSALLHAGLFGGAIILSKQQRKVAPSINKVALMVSMFQAEAKPPVKTSIKPKQQLIEKKIAAPDPIKVVSLPLPIPEITPKPTPVVELKPKIIPAPTAKTKPDKTPSPKLVRIKPTPKSIKPKNIEKQKKITKKKTRIKKLARHKIVKKKTVVKKRQTKKVVVKVKRHHQQAISTPVKRRATPQKHIKKQKSYSKKPQVNRRKVSSRAKPSPRSRAQVVRRVVSNQKVVSRRSAPSAQSINLSNQYKARLRQYIISKKRYPKRAKKRAQQGEVKISFNVLPNGMINNIRILKSSNSKTLDNAAIQAIKKSSGKLPFPRGMQKKLLNLSVVLSYVLR